MSNTVCKFYQCMLLINCMYYILHSMKKPKIYFSSKLFREIHLQWWKVAFTVHSLEKQKITAKQIFFRQTKIIVNFFSKTLIWRNFCGKTVAVKFRNFHSVCVVAWNIFPEINFQHDLLVKKLFSRNFCEKSNGDCSLKNMISRKSCWNPWNQQ